MINSERALTYVQLWRFYDIAFQIKSFLTILRFLSEFIDYQRIDRKMGLGVISPQRGMCTCESKQLLKFKSDFAESRLYERIRVR